MAEEGLLKTDNDLIYIGQPIPFDREIFLEQLENLMKVAYANKEKEIQSLVETIVTTYHPENAGNNPQNKTVFSELVAGEDN